MNLQKTIEILMELSIPGTQDLLPDDYDAIKLGIEAVKFRLRWEQQEGEDEFPPLPGETKE